MSKIRKEIKRPPGMPDVHPQNLFSAADAGALKLVQNVRKNQIYSGNKHVRELWKDWFSGEKAGKKISVKLFRMKKR